MPKEALRDRLENPQLAPLTERQVGILRLLGKGSSFRDKEIPQQFEGDAHEELGKIYSAFGVTGETAAVVHALNIGLLETEELIEEKFDWYSIDRLTPQYKAILAAFTHAKHEDLTEEEFNGLNIETTQSPKAYVAKSIDTICGRLRLGNKTEAIVYYYTWRERQKEQGDLAVPARETIPTKRQKQVLELLARGVDPSEIANCFGVKRSTVIKHKNKAVRQLKAGTVEEAVSKARELSMI